MVRKKFGFPSFLSTLQLFPFPLSYFWTDTSRTNRWLHGWLCKRAVFAHRILCARQFVLHFCKTAFYPHLLPCLDAKNKRNIVWIHKGSLSRSFILPLKLRKSFLLDLCSFMRRKKKRESYVATWLFFPLFLSRKPFPWNFSPYCAS